MNIQILHMVQAIYMFVARNAAVLLRLTWLPLLISALASTFTSMRLIPYLPALQSRNPEEIMSIMGPVFGWIALGVAFPIMMTAVAAVAVLRFVVRGERGAAGEFVHVAFGLTELRVIAVTIIIIVMMFLAGIPLVLILGMLASLVGAPIIAQVTPVIVAFFLLVVAARWLMAYPVAAIEDRISFERAWTLIRPTYRSFLGLIFALLLPLAMLDLISELLVAPPVSNSVEQMRQEVESRWILITGSGFVINFVVTCVFFTGLGVVYRNVSAAPSDLAGQAA